MTDRGKGWGEGGGRGGWVGGEEGRRGIVGNTPQVNGSTIPTDLNSTDLGLNGSFPTIVNTTVERDQQNHSYLPTTTPQVHTTIILHRNCNPNPNPDLSLKADPEIKNHYKATLDVHETP